MSRVFTAFLVIPLAFAIFTTWWSTGTPDGFPVVAMVAYPIILLLGAPVFALLRHFGWLRWWQVTLAGGVCAVPFIVYFAFVSSPNRWAKVGLVDSLFFLSVGAGIALAFWVLGLAGNSALTAAATPTRASAAQQAKGSGLSLSHNP